MASRTKRPTQTSGYPNAASGSLSIENEIERSRETERWEKVIEKADQLRQRPDKAAVLADLGRVGLEFGGLCWLPSAFDFVFEYSIGEFLIK